MEGLRRCTEKLLCILQKMRMMVGTAVLIAATWGGGSVMVDSVTALRDNARPLLVFTPSVMDHRFVEQVRQLEPVEAGLRERQVVVLVFPAQADSAKWRKGRDAELWREPADGAAARRNFGVRPGEFTVVLVGKDGGEKLREHAAIPFDRLRETIDAMPMRRDEMKRR
jgi:hypothetical protein